MSLLIDDAEFAFKSSGRRSMLGRQRSEPDALERQRLAERAAERA
jgi:hypothetical protein